jgi:hypothetical protein
MKRLPAAILPLALLAGCGSGGEDFAVPVRMAPAKVAAPLLDVDAAMARAVFPGLTIRTSRPSETEIVYTIPSLEPPNRPGEDSVIRLQLEPANSGKETIVHATVDVPEIPMMMGKPNMVLSERLVEAALRKILQKQAKNVSRGSSFNRTSQDMSGLLVALAISSNFKHQARVNQIRKNPDAALATMMGGLDFMASGGFADGTGNPGGWADEPVADKGWAQADTGGSDFDEEDGGWGVDTR